MSPPPIGGSYLGLLRKNRDFRLLYTATLISLIGDWFLMVALLDLVLTLTGQAKLASLVVVVMNLPVFLVTPWAGVQVDKLDRRKLMIGVDLMRTVAALLPLLATTSERLLFAYVGVCLISVGGAYFDPAADAAVPNLVAAEDLGRANTLLSSAWGTMMVAGASIGGLVTVYLGRNAAFIVNSVSFLASALLLLAIRTPFSECAPNMVPKRPFAEAMGEAMRFARERPRVLAFLLGKSGYGLAAGVVALLCVFGSQGLGNGPRGPQGIALLLSARGVGALCGPFLLRLLFREGKSLSRAIGPSMWLFALGYLGLVQGGSLWFGAACVFVAHLGGGALWMASTYGLQREVPDELRGRIFALDYGLVTLTLSMSSLLTGIFADRYGAAPVVTALAVLSMGWAGAWWFSTWRLWRPMEPPEKELR